MKAYWLLFCLIQGCLATGWAYNGIPSLAEIKTLPLKQVEQEANTYFEQKAYDKSYVYYLALSQMKKQLKADYQYRLGKTALYAKEYQLSKEYLEQVLSKENHFPLVSFEYANALKHLGKYKEAIQYFEHYIKQQTGPASRNNYIALARTHILACQKAIKEHQLPSSFAVGEIGGLFSTADASIRSITIPAACGYRLIEYQDEKGICIKKVNPNLEIEELNSNVSNPIFNSCSPHIAPDRVTVFFARQELSRSGNLEYKIYIGQISENGDIVEIEKLGPEINRDGYSSLYPCLGLTEHGQEVLYFSSSIPGGEGGFDIWYSVRLMNGEFTRPYNLGMRINTPNDEVTPFYYQEGNELFYSSDRPEGFGGFDVFKMTGEKRRWMEDQAFHLSYPINTAGNDTHFVKDNTGKGFLTSDRNGKGDQGLRHSEVLPVVGP